MKQTPYKEWIKSALIAAGGTLGGFVADFFLWAVGILLFSMPAALSQAAAYLITATNRYFLLSRIKYRKKKPGTGKRFFRFLSLSVAASAALSGSMIVLCFGFRISATGAKILITPALFWLNGKINRLVFAPAGEKPSPKKS